MYKNKSIIALIPARGGSKGLPGKNIAAFAGKPLIAWTIEQALACKCLNKVIVSTDSKKIAQISRHFGALVPFLRPVNLAGDEAKMVDVISHTIKSIEKMNLACDIVVLLQPTSPLRTAQDIQRGLGLLFKCHAKSVVSVSPVEHHPYFMNALPKNGCMKNFLARGNEARNRQELTPFYRINGALYLAYKDYLCKHRSFFGPDTFAYVMPPERSVDIDTILDFRLAEILLQER